jgi:dTDP-4-amino-4,6-dideoxygalactose transaminase
MSDTKEAAMSPIHLARPWFTEDEPLEAAKVVRSKWLISGPRVAEFENRFAEMHNVEHAVAVNSGSAALLVACQALGLKPDDEVIVPDITFVSSATAAMLIGGRPVFADINLENYCIDPMDLERRITPKTRIIIPVHYAGHTADMDRICEIAATHGLKVLEDAAAAHLSQYRGDRFAGSIGDIGIFSFTPSKSITTGEGGMIVTRDGDLAEKCRLLRNFNDTGKFEWDDLGFNWRMPEVMGAIGCEQLDKLNKIIADRRAIGSLYSERFAEEEAIITPKLRTPTDGNYQIYTIRLRLELLDCDRDRIIEDLDKRGVVARLYYPTMHTQKVFATLGDQNQAEMQNAVTFSREAMTIPLYTELSAKEQTHVVQSLLGVVREHRKN